MSRINALALDFLDKHPVDCARILEQVPTQTACSLLRTIPAKLAAGILECMLTGYASECLRALDTHRAVSIAQEMKTPHAARLLRTMAAEDARRILDTVPAHVKSKIHSALRYPDQAVGRVMDSNPFVLPESISIQDAVKRVRNLQERIMHDIFVVDENHKLSGVIHMASLFSAGKSSSVQTIIQRDVPYLSTRMLIHTAAVHAGWQTFDTLPVVGTHHVLSGILKSSTLMHVLAATESRSNAPSTLDGLFSLTKMYWLVMAELVNAVAGEITERGRGQNR